MKTFFDAANGVLLLLMTRAILVGYAALPERIPMHFDILGKPDRWGSKTSVFGLLGVAGILSLIFYVMIGLTPRLRRRPDRLNMPNKEQFLKLPPEKQEIYWNVIKEFLAAVLVGLNLIWYLIITGTLAIARGDMTTLPVKFLVGGLVFTAVILIIYVRRLIIMPKKLISGEMM